MRDTNALKLEKGEQIDAMAVGEIYKCVGVLQSKRTEHKAVKIDIQKGYITRLKAILRTKVNAKNIAKAI